MKFKFNPITGVFDRISDAWELKEHINPLTWEFNLAPDADSYKQVFNPLTWKRNLALAAFIAEVTGNWYINLTNAVKNKLLELKAYGWTEQGNLPSEYTQVEYLQIVTDGVYFSTGFTPTVNTDMGITAGNITSASAQLLVAQCISGGDYVRIAKASASQRIIANFGASSVTDNNTDGIDKFTARANKSGLYINGSLIGTFSNIPSSFTWIGEVDIFRGKYSDTSYYAYPGSRFYSAWIDDNVLLPCRRNSDNQLGIYNTKTGQFILPSGTGTFTAGADVVPSPSAPMDIICNNWALKVKKSNWLPLGYTQVEYIKNDANSFIDTGYKANLSTKAVIEFAVDHNQPSSNTGIFGDRVNDNIQAFYMATKTGTKLYAQFDSVARQIIVDPVYTPNQKYTSTLSKDGWYLESTLCATFNNATSFTTANSLLLFRAGTLVQSGVLIYKMTLYENDVIVHNYIPAKNSSNVLGMYDTVTGNFLTNAWSGSFSAWPVIELPVWYTKLKYIQSSWTQYINTGIKANSAYTYKFKVKRTSPYNTNIWGVKTNSSYAIDSCLIFGWTGTDCIGIYSHKGNDTGGNAQVVPWETGYHTIDFNPTTRRLIIDDIDRWSDLECWCLTNESWSSDTYNLYLGGTNTVWSFVGGGVAYWAEYEVWNGNTLLQKLIPAKNSSNVVGMYDTVSWQFFTNAGTWTFTAWPSEWSISLEVYADWITETIEDELWNTATAEMLLALGDYKDEQSILDGAIIRNVGIKILDGTENWTKSGQGTGWDPIRFAVAGLIAFPDSDTIECLSTHYPFSGVASTGWSITPGTFNVGIYNNVHYVRFAPTDITELEQWIQYIKGQYLAWTPVIMVYPLATSTTESVEGQALNIQKGNNTIEITEASIDGLPLSAKYLSI